MLSSELSEGLSLGLSPAKSLGFVWIGLRQGAGEAFFEARTTTGPYQSEIAHGALGRDT